MIPVRSQWGRYNLPRLYIVGYRLDPDAIPTLSSTELVPHDFGNQTAWLHWLEPDAVAVAQQPPSNSAMAVS